jgi:hypothetical protein
MNLTTANDLITFCLRASNINGVGQTPNAQDINDGLTLLQTMLAQWQRNRWLVPAIQEVVIPSTGAQSYTVGPVRPDRVDSAFARQVGSNPAIDYPLGVITAREDYNEITLKTLSTIPVAVFLDTNWPTGLLYFWPVPPSGQWEMHVFFKFPLPQFTNLTDRLDQLPPEYVEALMWSLMVRMQIAWSVTPPPEHVAAMQAALSTLRMANVQIPQAWTPTFSRRSGGIAAGSSPGFNSGWMI